MHRLLSRTSITIDEAVSILLGRSAGPIDFEPIDESEDAEANCPTFDESDDAEANCPTFCLREPLEDELDMLDDAYDLAKTAKQPAHVLAETLAALQQHEAMMEQANIYLCAIEDELNKGEQSALKVDSALSNTAYTYITLHSFNEWRKYTGSQGVAGGQPGAEVPAASVPIPVKSAEKKQPRTKLRQQEDAILAEILKQNLDPLALPPNSPGKPGVKAAVCEALKESPLFTAPTAFSKAWDRLRKDRCIVGGLTLLPTNT